MAKLIKIDRNGSKHYEGMITCDRCGGRGYYAIAMRNNQPVLSPLDSGVCWKCGGAGKVHGTWIERTPEYEAKLAAKRLERHNKKMAELEAKQAERKAHADELNAVFFQKQGFNAEGKTWVVLGDTYQIKDELKALGCRYTTMIGWHIDHDLDGYDTLMVDVEDCFYTGADGIYHWQNWKTDVADKIKEATKQINRSKSDYVGKVGDKIRITATMTGLHFFKTQFGDQHIYTFTDIFNNVFVWKTTSYLDRITKNTCIPVQKGEKVELIGTVKDHSEYNGIKQTVLTRCKMVEKEGE